MDPSFPENFEKKILGQFASLIVTPTSVCSFFVEVAGAVETRIEYQKLCMHKKWSKLPRIKIYPRARLSSSSLEHKSFHDRTIQSLGRCVIACLRSLPSVCYDWPLHPAYQNPTVLPVSRHGLFRREREHSHCLSCPPPPSTTIAHNHAQVLRYAALASGVGYGFSHQASLVAKAKVAHIDREFENQASLISKAKTEWVKKTMPKEEGSGEFKFFFGD